MKNNKAKRKILVIGGAGYIGSLLVYELLQLGYQIKVLDKLMFGQQSLRKVEKHPDLKIIVGDFRNQEIVVSAMQGVNSVIHLGGLVGDPSCNLNEDLSYEVNFAATQMIAKMAKECHIQNFIFASTCSVYGAGEENFQETSSLNPISIYAKTKAYSEKIILENLDAHFCSTVLRFATIYGVSPRPRFDLVVNLLVAKAMLENKITVYGGQQWRPFLHVEDAVSSIICCLQADTSMIKGEIFNVGSSKQNFQVIEIANLINEKIPQASIVIEEKKDDLRNYSVSFAKIENILHFTPSKTIQDGIEELKQFILLNKIQNYQQAQYHNHTLLSKNLQTELTG